jgi:ABC-type nitrate/sulfonate/bicarbonate transport system substrate-binding protein
MAKYSITIEGVSPFNGLDVLVARDEGLFAAEGLDLQLLRPAAGETRSTVAGSLSSPTTSQGWALERGRAAMFQG